MGHLHALGNFEECINFNTKLPTPFGQMEGQYCRADILLTPSSVSEDFHEASEIMNRFAETRQSRAPKLYLKSGICVPKTCSTEDLQNFLPFEVSMCKTKGKTPFEKLDYVAM